MGNEGSIIQNEDKMTRMAESLLDKLSSALPPTQVTVEQTKTFTKVEDNMYKLVNFVTDMTSSFEGNELIRSAGKMGKIVMEVAREKSLKSNAFLRKRVFISPLETEEELRAYMRDNPDDYEYVYYEMLYKMSVMWMRVFNEFTPLLDWLPKKIPNVKAHCYYPSSLLVFGSEEAVQYLLDLPGFDVNSKYDDIPLIYVACCTKRLPIIDMLIARGAVVDIPPLEKEVDGVTIHKTIFGTAIWTNDIEIIERVRSHANVTSKDVVLFVDTSIEVILHLFAVDLFDRESVRRIIQKSPLDIRDIHREYMRKNPETPEKFLRYCLSTYRANIDNVKKERFLILKRFFNIDSKNGPPPETKDDETEEKPSEEELQLHRDADESFYRIFNEYFYEECDPESTTSYEELMSWMKDGFSPFASEETAPVTETESFPREEE